MANYQDMNEKGMFYPLTYFSPHDYINCRKARTDQTYEIHLFHKSWMPHKARIKSSIRTFISNVIGGENIFRLRKFLTGGR
jgi:hypothetical protein